MPHITRNKLSTSSSLRQRCWRWFGLMMASGLLAILSTQASFAWVDGAMAEALANLEAGHPTQAYQALIDHEATYGGHNEFDLLLATAALYSGRPAEAALIAERLNEDAVTADRRELLLLQLAILKQTVDADDRGLRARYQGINPNRLLAHERQRWVLLGRLPIFQPAYHWFIAAGVAAGYDSNANRATSEESFLLGDQQFTLDQESQSTASVFWDRSVYSALTLNPAGILQTQFFASGSDRVYPSARFANIRAANGGVALRVPGESIESSLTLQWFYTSVDEQLNNRGRLIGLNLLGNRNGRWQPWLEAGFDRIRFPASAAFRDVNRDRGVLGLRYRSLDGQWSASIAWLFGKERTASDDERYSRNFDGWRGRFTSHIKRLGKLPEGRFDLQLQRQRSRYQGQYFSCSELEGVSGFSPCDFPRRDRAWQWRMKLDWPLAVSQTGKGGCHTGPMLEFNDNDSNLPGFGHDRWAAQWGIRCSIQ